MLSLSVRLDDIDRRRRSTGLLHIAAALFLFTKTLGYFRLREFGHLAVVIPLFVVVVASLLYGFFRKNWDPRSQANHWFRLSQVSGFAILAVSFINVGSQFDVIVLTSWAAICAILMFTERKIFHDANMLFKKEGIFIPGYFSSRQIIWKNIREVVIRPDFITIFKMNNRFLQFEVQHADPSTIDAIDKFCKNQILKKAN